MDADQRRRFEEVEKTLLALRREVGNILTDGREDRSELERHIGLLQLRLIALDESGDISAVRCREHARGISKLLQGEKC